MSRFRRIDGVYKRARVMEFDDRARFVMFSDCHRSNGSGSDNFAKNHNLYMTALMHYYLDGFTYFELGDGDELWESSSFPDIARTYPNVFALLRKFEREGRFLMLWGNHDRVKRRPGWVRNNLWQGVHNRTGEPAPPLPGVTPGEGIVLQHRETGGRILLVHGHQGDFFNDRLAPLSGFLVRHVWRPLELVGMRDPVSPIHNPGRKNKVEAQLSGWARRRRKMLVAGHTHQPVFPQEGDAPYFNSGCCVHPRYITAIEVDRGAVSLVKWSVGVRQDKSLYIKRDLLEGRLQLRTLFEQTG